MAKVAPKIIDKNAVPQKITMKEPAKGDNENPSNGTEEGLYTESSGYIEENQKFWEQ